MEKMYDYIIIGSGLGGLSVATLLSKSGKSVLVLEKHYAIGGLATNFTRGNFEFDVSLHQTGGIYKTFYNKILKECGVFNKLEFIKSKYLFEKKIENELLKVPNGNIKEYKKILKERFPQCKKDITLYFLLIKIISFQLKLWEYLNSNYFTSPFIRIFAPIICPLVIFSHKIKVDKFFSFIKNEKLKDILFSLVGYYKENSKDLTLNPFVFAEYGYYFDGGYYVKGGGQAVSNSFRKVIEDNKGEVKPSKEVDEILYKDKEVLGVKIKRGEKFYSKNIICNANPYEVYNRFLRAKKDIKKPLSHLEIGMSFIGAYIGLDTTIENLNKDFKNSYEIILDNSVLTLHTNLDKNLCPEGKSTIDVFIIEDKPNYHSLRYSEYKKEKENIKNRIIKILKKYFYNIEKHIEVFEVATPKTVSRYTNNPNGSIYGFKNKLGQTGFDRFNFKDKNFKNLYFSSAYTMFGGGYEGAIRNGYYLYQKLSGRNRIKTYIVTFTIMMKIFIYLYSLGVVSKFL